MLCDHRCGSSVQMASCSNSTYTPVRYESVKETGHEFLKTITGVTVYLGHDTEDALVTTTELINTSPAADGREGLPDLDALRDLAIKRQISGADQVSESDLDEVRLLRDRLHVLFAVDDAPTAAAMLNELLAEANVTPHLSDHDGYGLHIHYFAPGAPIAQLLAAHCGMALARVVAEGELERLRTCEAPDCGHVLVDLSKNRCRRYCDSRTCGNRLHVAAYRARRRASLPTA